MSMKYPECYTSVDLLYASINSVNVQSIVCLNVRTSHKRTSHIMHTDCSTLHLMRRLYDTIAHTADTNLYSNSTRSVFFVAMQ